MNGGTTFKTGFLYKEGAVRKNLKKRFVVVDKDGLTYYESDAEKHRAKPLGFVEAKAILATCEIGTRKKQDHCFEISTTERLWYFWADNATEMKEWMKACEQAKMAGRSNVASSTAASVAASEEGGGGGGGGGGGMKKSGSSVFSKFLGKKEEEDVDYIE